MSSWHSCPKIYNLGHGAVRDIFSEPVLIEEKIDGSQFSFGVLDGKLTMRSKNAEVFAETAGMFAKAVESVKERESILTPGWTYRAEYLAKPKHNTLAYERVPEGNLIIFDINTGEEEYLLYEQKKFEAYRLGLECVPQFEIDAKSAYDIKSLLEVKSCLGGQTVEGVVVKNYFLFTRDGKAMMGKYVSEAFKEVHKGEWKAANPNKKDIIEEIIGRYRTPARWEKAVQHLREAGKLEDAPKDIGALINEVQSDTLEEERAEIQGLLLTWAWGQIRRGIIGGLPEWYKAKLLDKQFEEKEEVPCP